MLRVRVSVRARVRIMEIVETSDCRPITIFSVFAGYFSETLEMRPALLYSDMQSVICFSVIPKRMTLNDLEWLFRVKFCFRAGLAGSECATFEI